MPNHVTNKLTISGNPDKVAECIQAIGRDVPRRPRQYFTGEFVCKGPGDVYGTLKETEGVIKCRGEDDIPLVDGEPPEGWEIVYEDAYRQHIDFATIVPPPDTPAYNDQPSQAEARNDPTWWYNWNVANWGTKWNAYDISILEDGVLQFDTAWSPPEPIFVTLSEKYPELEFEAKSFDEGWGFACVTTYKNGAVINEVSLECERSNPEFCEMCKELKGYDPRDEEDEEDED
jgi:hypothetical protein